MTTGKGGPAAAAAPTAQDEVIAFLEDTRTHGPQTRHVDVIETHGALVFLADGQVYKIKRAVQFPYMDFSTLELRRRACLRELELNAGNAPGLYLGVVPIVRGETGRLAIGGPGEPVEWAVHMRRFPADDLLGNVAAARGIDARMARALAEAAYASHMQAAVAAEPAAAVARMGSIVAEVVQGLRSSHGGLPAEALTRLERCCAQQLGACRPVLEARAREGFVRRCHGDLHLGNIVLWQGRPVPFDALEFDEELATIDTLYDLAFLLMDLDRRATRQAANTTLNRYLWRSQHTLDLAGLRALPLFLGLRAGIRAMVSRQRAAQHQDAAASAGRHEADSYLDAALAYLAPPGPRLVAVGGLSGSGKSTLAALLAPGIGAAPGAVHLRSDLERKAMHGVGETDRLPAAAYTPEAGRAVYARLGDKARSVLVAGHAAVVDAAFLDAPEREAIEAVARDLAVDFCGLWLEAPAAVLESRVASRADDASDATVDVLRQQLGKAASAAGWSSVDAAGTVDGTLAGALRRLGRR